MERQRQTMTDRLGNRGIDNFYNKQTLKLEEAKAYQTPGVQKAGEYAETVWQTVPFLQLVSSQAASSWVRMHPPCPQRRIQR